MPSVGTVDAAASNCSSHRYVGLIDGQLFTATLGMDYFDGLDPSDAFKRQDNLPRVITGGR